MNQNNEGQQNIELLSQQFALFLQQMQQAQTPQEQEPAERVNETMDVKEAAAYLRVSDWTIYDMVRTKSIAHFRVRSRIFFKKRELDQWINQQMQEAVEA